MMSKHKFSRVFLYLLVSTGVCFPYSVSALSIKDFLGIGTDEAISAKAEKKQQKSANEKPISVKESVEETGKSAKRDQGQTPEKANLGFSDVKSILSMAVESERKKILADEKAFNDFIKREAANVSVLTAARANKIEAREKVQILAQRSVDNIVREVYLNQLLTSNVPVDFPNNEQIQKYYEENKDKFVIEKRMHIWQIFLPIDEGMTQKEVESLRKRAESISKDLKKKKIDFPSAASEHSKHAASRFNGGYTGMVKLSKLKPEFKALPSSLEQGGTSEPIETDEGIYILKLGAVVPEQSITLQQVRPKIKELMLQQLKIKLRQAVFDQAIITYPIDLKDKNLEEWRLKLRTN